MLSILFVKEMGAAVSLATHINCLGIAALIMADWLHCTGRMLLLCRFGIELEIGLPF